ncbi:MAG: hypothetical protein EOO52_05025 [Gammaproteobacteria bacterium]|nr:MAG: hypothetical protein EOO52_05025 [Gammaproteobacteria bacterium]
MQNQLIRSANTTMTIHAQKNDVWSKVGFYEHVKKTPNWLLKLSLPTPQQVEGQYSKVGDICRCKYSDGGYLTKRITNIVSGNRIEFEIIEQSIRFQHTIKLLGGYIEVCDMDGENSVVKMVTYYENRIFPQNISSVFINQVIKTMHKFVIQDMQSHFANQTLSVIEAV